MARISRLVLLPLAALVFAAPAFGLNVVNTSWTVQCLFSPSCTVYVTDHGSDFAVPGGAGNGRLQSRIFQGQAGTAGAYKWVYEYRINLTQVAGYTYIPYVDQMAISGWGPVLQFDYNSDGVNTDHVFNITSGGVGSKAVTGSFVSWGWTFFTLNNPVYAGSYPGGGESSYFFGLTSDYPPVLKNISVHTDSGWVTVTGYAPDLP